VPHAKILVALCNNGKIETKVLSSPNSVALRPTNVVKANAAYFQGLFAALDGRSKLRTAVHIKRTPLECRAVAINFLRLYVSLFYAEL
jgi:hypothetical protein